MIRVGLTGGIASGKSTVGEMLRRRGAVLVDADQLARDVVAPGTEGLAAVAARFGPGVLAADGGLDRAALGALVFDDEQAREDLNGIVHPLVRAARASIEAQVLDPRAIVVQMIPLLVETGQAGAFDAVVVVDVAEQVQRERLMERNALDAEQAQARIDAQASRAERLRVADYVILNDAGLAELEERTHAVWHELLELRSGGGACGC